MLLNEIDLKEEVPISQGFTYAKMTPDIRRAELNYIRPILGVDLYSILEGAYDGDTLDADQTLLMEYVQPVIAHLALAQYLPKGNLYVGDNGLQANHSGDSKPAFEWQVRELQKSLMDNGFDALDELIRYLESVADTDFPDWLLSEGCTLVRSNFINTAKDFTEQVPKMKGSRYLFTQVKPVMARIEKKLIKNVVGTDLYAELKAEILADDLSEANEALMEYISPAVAHLAWSESLVELSLAIDAEGVHMFNNTFSGTNSAKQPANDTALTNSVTHHKALSMEAVEDLKVFLVDNLDDYPLFEDGDTYDADDTNPKFENDVNSGICGLI